MEGVKEFLESSTIHGLVYISTTRGLVRLLWLSVVISGFIGAGVLIQESFSSWATSPVSTTIETLPISDLDFPNVTVCPPRNSFTSLNPDLVRARNIALDEEKQDELIKLARDSTFEENLRSKYQDYVDFIQDQDYIDFYTGIAKIKYPDVVVLNGKKFKNFEYHSTSFYGSITSPYFRHPFDGVNFAQLLSVIVFIYVPKIYNEDGEAFLSISIEYDIEKTSSFETIELDCDGDDDSVKYLDKAKSIESFEYSVWNTTECRIRYLRDMEETEYQSWSRRRHTGMYVYWGYMFAPENSTSDYRFAGDNKYFIHLANIIHEKKNSENVQSITNYNLKEKRLHYEDLSFECFHSTGTWDILMYEMDGWKFESIYVQEIYLETLETAIDQSFNIFFCPDYDLSVIDFYWSLFNETEYRLETMLRTLARVSREAKEKKLTNHHNVANTLLDRAATIYGLQYKDIVAMTSQASQLINRESQGMELGSSNSKHCQKLDDIEQLINHPVHISDKTNSSVFIPFCFFGGFSLGRESGGFQEPVCDLFKRKVVRGKVCYEADINQFKGKVENWEEALQKGFSFIVDTNDEFDMKNLMEKNSFISSKADGVRYLTVYHSQQSESEKKVNILLKTISDGSSYQEASVSIL